MEQLPYSTLVPGEVALSIRISSNKRRIYIFKVKGVKVMIALGKYII